MSDAERKAVRIYADGVFDLFHSGHLEFLQKARRAAGGADGAAVTLIVGVITDAAAGWKRLPVIPHIQRVEMLKHCRLVDEVVAEPPLVLTSEFLDLHRVTHVVHGDDDLQEEFFQAPRERRIMRYVPYTRDGSLAVSTSEIIARIRERPGLAAAGRARRRADAHRPAESVDSQLCSPPSARAGL